MRVSDDNQPSTVEGFAATFLSVIVVMAVAGLVAEGCKTAPDPLLTTGDAIEALGETFVDLAPLMEKAYDDHVITPQQYQSWATFAQKFKLTYPVAIQLWKATVATGDSTAQAKVEAIIVALSGDVAIFQSLIAAPAKP